MEVLVVVAQDLLVELEVTVVPVAPEDLLPVVASWDSILE
jgi:hypothetical protein